MEQYLPEGNESGFPAGRRRTEQQWNADLTNCRHGQLARRLIASYGMQACRQEPSHRSLGFPGVPVAERDAETQKFGTNILPGLLVTEDRLLHRIQRSTASLSRSDQVP